MPLGGEGCPAAGNKEAAVRRQAFRRRTVNEEAATAMVPLELQSGADAARGDARIDSLDGAELQVLELAAHEEARHQHDVHAEAG
jgi:hypothetical protein